MTTSVLKMHHKLVAVTEERDRLAAELQKLREQEPFCFATPVALMGNDWGRAVFFREKNDAWKATVPLYAAPVAAPAAPAPDVPEEWREVMAELAADLQSACDAEHPHREHYPSVMRKYQNDMRIVERARALLQSADHSAEVKS